MKILKLLGCYIVFVAVLINVLIVIQGCCTSRKSEALCDKPRYTYTVTSQRCANGGSVFRV